jgi:hypothetical protein
MKISSYLLALFYPFCIPSFALEFIDFFWTRVRKRSHDLVITYDRLAVQTLRERLWISILVKIISHSCKTANGSPNLALYFMIFGNVPGSTWIPISSFHCLIALAGKTMRVAFLFALMSSFEGGFPTIVARVWRVFPNPIASANNPPNGPISPSSLESIQSAPRSW